MKFKALLSITFILSFVFVLLTSSNLMDEWEVPAEYALKENPYVDKADDDNVGQELWIEHCKSCHGKTGNGDGKKAEELETEMRDFEDEEVLAQNDGELYYKSFIGRDEMPNFEKDIPDEQDRWMLINYLRTLVE